MDNVRKVLDEFGAEAVQRAMRNLGASRTIDGKKARRVASGKLKNSLTYGLWKKGPKDIVYFTTDSKETQVYADFIEQGVNGYERNRDAPYSFKRGGGGKKYAKGELGPMAKAIYEWMRIKPIKLRNTSGRFIKSEEEERKRVAIMIAGSIRKKGIAGIRYFGEAIENTLEDFGPQFTEALNLEIQSRLKNDQYKAK
jgi:hypothetical protein